MSAGVLVGLDVGTTNTKALVVGTDGREVADARVPTSWTERGAWVETSAAALVTGTLEAVADALEAAAVRLGTDVHAVGVGITGMAECGVLLAADGSVRAPVIAWFDPRGSEELAQLPAHLRDAFPGTTGLPLSTLPTLSKLLRLRGQGVGAQPGECWLNVPEYLAHVLGADRATEPSLASRTGLLDQATAAPWPEALDAVGAGTGLLPVMLPAGTALGQVGAPAAPPALAGAVVVVAGHDHPVASFGAGAWGPADLFDSFGTAESVVRVVAHPLDPVQRRRIVGLGLTAGAHVLEDRWVVSGPTRAGLVLRRVLGLLGMVDDESRARLDEAWSPDAAFRGAVVGGANMTDDDVVVRTTGDGVDPAAVWAAALEHCGTTVRALAATIDDEVGTPRRGVVAAGGWTRMSSVRAAKARAMADITFSSRQQPGAYGAATLAAWAASGRGGTAVDFALGFSAAPAGTVESLPPQQGART